MRYKQRREDLLKKIKKRYIQDVSTGFLLKYYDVKKDEPFDREWPFDRE